MKTQTALLIGMHCSACEKVVTKRIASVPGVQKVEVDVEKGEAVITSENGVSNENVIDVLQDTHYTITNITQS